MKGSLGHIGINLSNSEESFTFWKDMLSFLEFEIQNDGNHFDARDGNAYFCMTTTKAEYRDAGYHRKQTGLGHVAFSVDSPQDVDQFVNGFLIPRSIEPLYGGAKYYPDYADGYYAVYFEDPDRIKIEITFDPSALAQASAGAEG